MSILSRINTAMLARGVDLVPYFAGTAVGFGGQATFRLIGHLTGHISPDSGWAGSLCAATIVASLSARSRALPKSPPSQDGGAHDPGGARQTSDVSRRVKP
jgi:hypothetical protein